MTKGLFILLMTVVMVTEAFSARLRPVNIPQPSLVATVHNIFKNIRWQQTANNTDSGSTTTAAPAPGKLNVCEDLCPKWCQIVEGTERSFTHCHYLCGNLCDRKTRINNPFIGNSRYEVVPSEFEFGRYDLNGDKLVSMEEFSQVEEITPDEASDLFNFVDVNSDGFIDTDEFHGSPLVFTVQMAAELSSLTMNGISHDPSTQ